MANEVDPIRSSVYSTLPLEIWRMIFASANEVVEPMDNHCDGFDPLNERFHIENPITSKSTQYTLMFVSKVFNALAVEFFLQTVTISGTKQLTLLYKCLRKSSNFARNFARWTRRFDFHSEIISFTNLEGPGLFCLAPILRICRNLTHLIIELPRLVPTDGKRILNACLESCRVLEVLHWGIRCPVPRSKFISTFRHIRIIRLSDLNQFTVSSQTSTSRPLVPDEFPFLHTIEGGRDDFSILFENVSLPSLSTVHIRNEDYKDVHLPSNTGLHAFAQKHGERIKTLTMVGVVGVRHGPAAVPFLRQFTTLQELVVDVADLLRLISYGNFIHPHVVRLGLTNYCQAIPWRTRDSFRAALPGKVKARFPALKVLRWFGYIFIPSSDANDHDDWEGTEGIRIEDRNGEQLKLSWLSMV
ncbi:hypothetical protein BD410DRAFT_52113 [Rickenella mellea]|uniref:F-box domain-containing protein n=1 Tax=Rickenella mellea TaxID=50990 RepID=A0A4R5XFZ6_9AGAM|nr:hypothetical protein BD410DRAFT_52113 [Rickenella mellea]